MLAISRGNFHSRYRPFYILVMSQRSVWFLLQMLFEASELISGFRDLNRRLACLIVGAPAEGKTLGFSLLAWVPAMLLGILYLRLS